jgi:hypothetical protein
VTVQPDPRSGMDGRGNGDHMTDKLQDHNMAALMEWAKQSIAIALQVAGQLPIVCLPEHEQYVARLVEEIAANHELPVDTYHDRPVRPGYRVMRVADFQADICCACIRILRPMLSVYPLA